MDHGSKSMTEVHCFTSISFSYLDRARILAETVKRYHPDWVLWVCISDREPPGFNFNIEDEAFDRVVYIDELIPKEKLSKWAFGHDVVELCTAVKGPMLVHLLSSGAGKVVYFDPDIALFSEMTDLISCLENYSIVLTPHLVTQEDEPAAIEDNEIGSSLKYGIFNLGFVAVRNCNEGFRFARWWAKRLMTWCIDDVPAGLFTDQRWCDLVPALFDNVYIWRDPGCNVASWNLNQRPLKIDSDGRLTAAGATLKFFHFTKITTAGEIMLDRYSRGRLEVYELMHWYRSRLLRHVAPDVPKGWWWFGSYSDGSKITLQSRRTYRYRQDLQEAFPNPFASGSPSYQQWYKAEFGDI